MEVTMSDRKILQNQTALVTGSSSGIGAGIVKAMAAAGANVIVNFASSEESANKVVAEIIAAGGKAIAVRADVSDEEQVIAMFKKIADTYGTIDILINNSGV
jgi:NAD(P)-dependent dehydrogenase (short-subunit alcohol dehydrogenase family)